MASEGFKKRILTEIARMRKDLDRLEDEINAGDGRATEKPDTTPPDADKDKGKGKRKPVEPPEDDDDTETDDDDSENDSWP